jgi:hypothetical protein
MKLYLADAIEHLDADQPEAIVGKGVEHRPDGQDSEPGKKQGLAPPTVGGAGEATLQSLIVDRSLRWSGGARG